ncbi:hypothetical protein Y032_0028g1661 [Ancylostoma ceylanicum]|uniref:Uncharacterized protein n=1 Tax=Ancylostoma ceylanicum TaxID=53326 RepID=A0A016URP3_9BILA|nr:hypothetical protein Y032_0028g1661 [Ancylostoma ceylanicum]
MVSIYSEEVRQAVQQDYELLEHRSLQCAFASRVATLLNRLPTSLLSLGHSSAFKRKLASVDILDILGIDDVL